MDLSRIVILFFLMVYAVSDTESKCSEYVLVLKKRSDELHPVVITKIDWDESPEPYNATETIHGIYNSKATEDLVCFKSTTMCIEPSTTTTTTSKPTTILKPTTSSEPTTILEPTSTSEASTLTTPTTTPELGTTLTTAAPTSTISTTEYSTLLAITSISTENGSVTENIPADLESMIGPGSVPEEEKWIDMAKFVAIIVGCVAVVGGLTVYGIRRCKRSDEVKNMNADLNFKSIGVNESVGETLESFNFGFNPNNVYNLITSSGDTWFQPSQDPTMIPAHAPTNTTNLLRALLANITTHFAP